MLIMKKCCKIITTKSVNSLTTFQLKPVSMTGFFYSLAFQLDRLIRKLMFNATEN